MGAFDLPSSLARFHTFIEAVAAVSGKNDKIAIIGDHLHDDDIVYFLQNALSPYITFGVKKLPERVSSSGHAVTLEETKKLLSGLATREITGNEAQDIIASVFGRLSMNEYEALKRILLKDLRAGFSESSVNKAKKGTIPVFSCQLANSSMPDVTELTYPVSVEPKYDGVRCIAIKKGQSVQLLSRSGKPFDNFEEVETFLIEHMPEDFVFDGEVLHSTMLGEDGFQAVMKRAKASRGKNVEGRPVRYQVFDGMSLEEWSAQSCNDTLTRRRKNIEDVINQMPEREALFGLSPSQIAYGHEQLMGIYSSYVHDGFEGVIIKSQDGSYTFKRNKTWMKLKPFETADLTVTSITEGNGKYEGMLGTLVCEGTHDGKNIVTEVGSGFSDDQRGSLFAVPPIGQVAEVRYQDITLAQDAAAYSLRFPTFVRFRSGAEGEKI